MLNMGRIKTQLVKRATFELYKNHREEFKTDFYENKEIVRNLMDFSSKKLLNVVSGYVTRLVREEEKKQ